MPLHSFGGKHPKVAPDAFIAPSADLVGEVYVEARASVWFGAVLRGDFSTILIGSGSSVQDNAVVHCAAGLPTVVGRNVTIGHGALLEGCVIDDGAVIGMGAIVLQRAHVGRGSMIAAGAVVREGQEIPPGVVAAGAPAVIKKELEGSSRAWVESAALHYQELRARYLGER
jgi:carbonic anhydrase/acetyltransferase-like protein (isoleucine patch superfamily)